MVDRPDPASIFSDALELPPGRRASFLDEVCGDDAALRAEVESLLSVHTRAQWALHPNAIDASVGETAREIHDPMIGRRIGAYRIEKLIDTGGMGAVYLGKRSDAEFDKLVAIKVFRAVLGGERMLARFRTERQVLANLEHANIARLIDGGALEEGTPYIIMEFVGGVPLDRHARERRLSITDRLHLFRLVCEAVSHAHRNLVVHRDLKPANILVDREGNPKLLDFGIAKVLEEDGMPVDHTVTRHRVLTPRYASPEQVRGEPVTTATDVYSLGVMLFELTCGVHPHEGRTGLDLDNAISTIDPPRPSTVAFRSARMAARVAEERRASAGSIRRRLRGDLDTILLKALEKDPARRYASVADFSDDILCHLEGRAVRARPKTPGYRASTFVRRNKAVVTAVVALVLVLVAGLVASTSQYLRAEERSRDAQWQAYTAGIASAENALRSNQVGAARRFLDQTLVSLRGWEWQHLQARLDRSAHVIDAHDHWVTGLDFSGDGRLLASGSYDQTVRIWELDPPRLLRTMRRETAEVKTDPWQLGVLNVAFHPHDTRVLAGYITGLDPARESGGAVTVWDARSGDVVDSVDHYLRWAEVAWDARGEQIAVGEFDGRVEIFRDGFDNLTTTLQTSLRSGDDHRRAQALAFHPAKDWLATARSFVEVWNVSTGARIAALPAVGEGVGRLAWGADGATVAAATRLGPIVVWDAANQRQLATYSGHDGPAHDLVLGQGFAASAGSDTRVLLWDPGSGVTRATMPGHESAVRSIALSPDENWIATGDETGQIRIWNRHAQDVPTLKIPQQWRPTWANAVAILPDGSGVLTGGTNRRVELWDRHGAAGPQLLEELDVCGAEELALAGNWLLVRNELGFVTLADYRKRSLTRLFRAHGEAVTGVTMRSDGQAFATVGADSLLRVWTVEDLPAVVSELRLERVASAIAYAGGWIIVGDSQGGVQIRDASSAELHLDLDAHAGAVTDIAPGPEGRTFATTSDDGAARLWSSPGGELLHDLVRSERGMNRVAFSHDGTRIFVGGEEGTVRVLDPASGRAIVRLGGHSSGISSIDTGDDGLMVSAARDGTVRLWDVRDPEMVVPLPAALAPDESEAHEGLLAWWRGEGDAMDLVGEHHGLLQNGVDFAPGMRGDAFRFDGEVDVLRIDDMPAPMRDGRSFTVSAWVAGLDDQPPWGTVFSCRADWNPRDIDRGWELFARDNRWWLGPRATDELILSDELVSADGFTHLALAFDHVAGYATLYINGRAQSETLDDKLGWAHGGALRIGRSTFNEDAWYLPFSGLIDEVKVFGRAFTAEEVGELYREHSRE